MSTRGVNALVRRWWDGELGTTGVLCDVLLAPAEAAYRAAVAVRNVAYDRAVLGSARADIPVISVGNIAVGGTGKTPFTRWLADTLTARGEQPAVLHGGYAADEPELHRRWSPQVSVIVGGDRVASVRAAQQAGATVAVLDDAFQHRRLHRDLDIVLVSAERWLRGRRLLPRGPWREPARALRRADLLVCTRKTASAEDAHAAGAGITAASGHERIAHAHIRPGGWQHGGAAAAAPGGPALLVAALAEPGSFEANARSAGADVAERMIFPDHHAYSERDGAAIRQRAAGRAVVTTEKDWTKLDRYLDADAVWLLTQNVVIETGSELIDAQLRRILR